MGEEKQEWDVEIRFQGDMSIKIKRETTGNKQSTKKHIYCFTRPNIDDVKNETQRWTSATNNNSNIVRCDEESQDESKFKFTVFHNNQGYKAQGKKVPLFDTTQIMLVKYPDNIYLFSVPRTGKYLEPTKKEDNILVSRKNEEEGDRVFERFFPIEVKQHNWTQTEKNADAIFFKDGTFRCIPKAIRHILGDNKLKSMPNRLIDRNSKHAKPFNRP